MPVMTYAIREIVRQIVHKELEELRAFEGKLSVSILSKVNFNLAIVLFFLFALLLIVRGDSLKQCLLASSVQN
jgi:hypothetical protein